MTLLLPDFSEFQAGADLAGVKRMNGGAVILRAAYGTSHPDAAFASHRAAAASLGYSFCGLYQYLVAGQDAVTQAREFIRLAGRLAPHEVAILDLEEGDGDQAPRAAQWATLVDGTLGGMSWLYSGLDFAQEHGLAPVFAGKRHTWVAAYGDTEPSLGHTLWQSTDGKTGSNITDWPGAGRCDTNVYHGTLAQLAALAGPARQEAAVSTPPVPRPWVTAGQDSLHDLAASHGTQVGTILRLTAEHSPGGAFPGPVADYVNAVFAGQADPLKPAPKGLALYLPG
jgi:GH25 family lysozyme M1 (1,4-beta-N-acetylmuramidase)